MLLFRIHVPEPRLTPVLLCSPQPIAEHKIFAWYFLRAGLAVASAVCEAVFIQGTAKRYGKVVAGYALAFLTFGSGPFFSAVAFVPSSVCM